MKKITKAVSVFALVLIRLAVLPQVARAACPVCTVAIAGGLGLSRYLGVDDIISGIWIGGLTLSSSLWLLNWLTKKKYLKEGNNPKVLLFVKYLIIVLAYLLILVPLAWKGIVGHPFNTILGIDKLIVGTALGTLAFLVGLWADKRVRKLKGKQLFNYQKVVFPVLALATVSIIFYFVTR